MRNFFQHSGHTVESCQSKRQYKYRCQSSKMFTGPMFYIMLDTRASNPSSSDSPAMADAPTCSRSLQTICPSTYCLSNQKLPSIIFWWIITVRNLRLNLAVVVKQMKMPSKMQIRTRPICAYMYCHSVKHLVNQKGKTNLKRLE